MRPVAFRCPCSAWREFQPSPRRATTAVQRPDAPALCVNNRPRFRLSVHTTAGWKSPDLRSIFEGQTHQLYLNVHFLPQPSSSPLGTRACRSRQAKLIRCARTTPSIPDDQCAGTCPALPDAESGNPRSIMLRCHGQASPGYRKHRPRVQARV